MSNFKEFYLTEGRDKWSLFELKRTSSRWSFQNLDTGKRYFVKLGGENEFGSIQKFLMSILATPKHGAKSKGEINFLDFATEVLNGTKNTFYVKSSFWEKIKKTWEL